MVATSGACMLHDKIGCFNTASGNKLVATVLITSSIMKFSSFNTASGNKLVATSSIALSKGFVIHCFNTASGNKLVATTDVVDTFYSFSRFNTASGNKLVATRLSMDANGEIIAVSIPQAVISWLQQRG